MGRLVYVREVRHFPFGFHSPQRNTPSLHSLFLHFLHASRLRVPSTMYDYTHTMWYQDREAEPRFSNPTPRGGGFAGGYGGGGGGAAFQGGYGGGMQQGGGGGGGRQLYVSNLPYTVGWQDLKDLFRQASKWYTESYFDFSDPNSNLTSHGRQHHPR